MTINDTETTAVVFDHEAHTARGLDLTADVKAKREVLDLAIAEAEAAEAAEDELDILTDSNSKITKTRLDHERATAKVDAAKTALSVAERRLKGWNDGQVAELLQPLLTDLVGNHPAIATYSAPVEPEWESLPVPCLVAVQESPTEMGGRVVQPVIDSDVEPGYGQYSAKVTLTYLHDAGLHRDILGDGTELLRKAQASQVGIFQSLKLDAEPVRALHIDHGSVGDLAISRVGLNVRLHPGVPIIPNPSIGSLEKLLASRVAEVVGQTGRALGRTLIGSDVTAAIVGSRVGQDGSVTTTVEARGAVADTFGTLVGDGQAWSAYAEPAYRQWIGHVDSSLGRCSAVTFRPDGQGYRVQLSFISRRG